ncbi:MAG: acyl-CoA synthetase [Lautropia sp.]|nr:MAG: acyl-CoA synthetase [Pseudomonadota bacterium]MBC6960277.1 acyl-CoA synthetase [Lautropia sp.]MCL4701998.1 acyl-CoA synthetase [Burkholderiaceae bacterium]MDL1906096.1 acyl-CoA synthetase [Betaproteobacteria bacterium PRO1]RIK91424.1 MAG: acyl-CoA synthetase [Burkholderiales bacterium]
MPTHPNPFRQDLDRNAANYVPLSPISLVEWAADVFPDRCAVVHGPLRYSWSQMMARARRLASVLAARGIGAGDTVSAVLPNIPAMLDAHFGVPMTGAVLNTINTRLDPATVAFQLRHSGARVLITDREFSPMVAQALAQLDASGHGLPFVVDVDDPVHEGHGERIGSVEYEDWIAGGDPAHRYELPPDEWDAIGLNYTSGTTGDPKGVVVHHRGAYLNAVGNVLAWSLPRHPVYLWTLPLFHCNGWCFPWTLPAVAGTNVCLRRIDAALILGLVREHRVTHYCGAPIVHSTLINAPAELKAGIDWTVRAMVAGAAPPASMIEGMERMGWEVTHVYGLTEVYGPASVCVKRDEWEALDLAGRVEKNGRQGVRYQVEQGLTVVDPETMQEVPRDGETMGEVVFRGNVVMKGYLKNPKASAEAFRGGWFHTGDLGVVHPDGYVKLKDRAKDIIISGGENISSIEVEDALYKHPAVLACAVVARPDPKWGETPLAFVELKAEREPASHEAAKALADELIAHCRSLLAHFKCPREVRFGAVPKTSTGKIQKHLLREQARSAAAIG